MNNEIDIDIYDCIACIDCIFWAKGDLMGMASLTLIGGVDLPDVHRSDPRRLPMSCSDGEQ